MTMISDFAPTRARAIRPTRSVWQSIVTAVKVMRERSRLTHLEDRQLADIGLDSIKAAREADRPFWDLPAGR